MKSEVTININGKNFTAEVEDRTMLSEFIRENARLTGTHIGCDTASCGACTVIMNGKSVKSCTVPVGKAQGGNVKTVEGLSDGDGGLHPLQEGFNEHHGLQCGFCTPGMIMASYQLLEQNSKPTDEEIRHSLEGNFCRCTGYDNIVKAVRFASNKI